jgi:hypothetical protein
MIQLIESPDVREPREYLHMGKYFIQYNPDIKEEIDVAHMVLKIYKDTMKTGNQELAYKHIKDYCQTYINNKTNVST